ncbi:hypothetical protein CFIO01_08923 [Colletotrichum fioriniae PJ7]|uniref:Uncharacterized protein n=1 Tax=Colletotrichum fioriniae PJ7 TaxID=1445577 RepID=A0A010RY03_9PEZI|nr:hypothetical protein CFIO01_08923 [Colletotrichum fioriniae PJ7]
MDSVLLDDSADMRLRSFHSSRPYV